MKAVIVFAAFFVYASCAEQTSELRIRMPTTKVQHKDEYRCVIRRIEKTATIATVVPRPSDFKRVHHMTLFLCNEKGIPRQPHNGVFPCEYSVTLSMPGCTIAHGYDGMEAQQMSREPTDGEMGLVLPKGYGFSVGPGSVHEWALIQVHNNLPIDSDNSGFDVTLSDTRSTHEPASFPLVCEGAALAPHKPALAVSCLRSWPFGTAEILRLHFHFHSLGTQIQWLVEHANGAKTTKVFHAGKDSRNLILSAGHHIQVGQGDKVRFSCTYNTESRDAPTYFGMRAADEMCNVFILYAIPAR